jgi:hypothetical protein
MNMKKTLLLIQFLIFFLFYNCSKNKSMEDLLKSLDDFDKYIKSNNNEKISQTNLIILDDYGVLADTINGNVKEFEHLCYLVDGSDSIFIGPNSYKYLLKDNRILEKQWFGYVDNKPITWKYYYTKDNLVPDSIILDDVKNKIRSNIGKEFGELNKVNTHNTIDSKGFLTKQLRVNSNHLLIMKKIFNYDSLGRLKEIYYKDINLRDLYTNNENQDDRVFSQVYEYVGNTKEVKYIYSLTNNKVVSKYDKSENSERGIHFNYDKNKNWRLYREPGNVHYIRNIKYQ